MSLYLAADRFQNQQISSGLQSLTTEQFKCMKSHGYSFFIGRVHESNGAVDSHGIQNLKNAKAGELLGTCYLTYFDPYDAKTVQSNYFLTAGITNVDGYIFPCTTSSCASPASQVQSTVNALKSAGASVGMLWLDIEIYHWPADHTKNRQFIEAMGKELTALGHNWGVYSSYNNWQSIVGLDYTGMSHKQLWWATYNNEAVSDIS
ncbi:unnamed protein product, partial [Cylicostephanus goldi]